MDTLTIKALSIRQPWATMIAHRQKTIETRTWRVSYRGPLLICATKAPIVRGLPSGKAVALVRLADVRPMVPSDEEDAYGPCAPGLYSWILDDIMAIEPFPVSGRYGLFPVRLPWCSFNRSNGRKGAGKKDLRFRPI